MSLDVGAFDELMGIFRARDQLVSSGFTLDVAALKARGELESRLRDFLVSDAARMSKFYDVCKRTHWTLITRERLFALHAVFLAATERLVADDNSLLSLLNMSELKIKPFPSTHLPLGRLNQLPSLNAFNMLLHARLDSYLLLRVISTPIPVCGFWCIAEDRTGNAVWVHAFFLPCSEPRWTALKVRDRHAPWLHMRVASNSRATMSICCRIAPTR